MVYSWGDNQNGQGDQLVEPQDGAKLGAEEIAHSSPVVPSYRAAGVYSHGGAHLTGEADLLSRVQLGPREEE